MKFWKSGTFAGPSWGSLCSGSSLGGKLHPELSKVFQGCSTEDNWALLQWLKCLLSHSSLNMQITKPTLPSQQCVILYPLVFICSLNTLFLRAEEKEIILQACPLNYSTSCHLIKKPAVINKTTLNHSPAVANLRRNSLSPRLPWKGSEIRWQPQIRLSAPANIPARSTTEPNRDRNVDFQTWRWGGTGWIRSEVKPAKTQ